MFKAPVFTAEGERSSERTLPPSFFDGVVHEAAMWQAVKAYRANQRLGTAATKNRSQVRGGNRKPWRQKGTGRARHGSIRSPIWRGGGVAFGPRGDQNFRERIPRKVKGLARRSAFNARAEDGRVILLDGLSLDAPKTKRIIALLESLGAEGNVLLLTDGPKSTVHLSARNIPQVLIRPFGQESTYDVLWSDTVIIEASALDSLPEGGEEAGKESEAPAAPRKRPRKPKADAAAEVAAEAAREPTAGTEPETQPSDTLAGEPEPDAAEEPAPRKRRTRKKAAEPEEGEE